MFFTDYFKVSKAALNEYGATDICLVQDLPLFIDPFLLYASKKATYKKLHEQIVKYLVFLKDRSIRRIDNAELKEYYCFKEIHQNWLGFTLDGNMGSGLNLDFAKKLYRSLHGIFRDFGNNGLTQTQHLEKLILLEDGVGRDKISDFTANLIIDFLASYTEKFAKLHIAENRLRSFTIGKAVFDYETGFWIPKTYKLPCFNGDFVLLTPKDILAKDDTWINKNDLYAQGLEFYMSVKDNDIQRYILNEHFREQLRAYQKNPTKPGAIAIMRQMMSDNPKLLDYYIKTKEDCRNEALESAAESVEIVNSVLCENGRNQLRFFSTKVSEMNFANTFDEARWYAATFKKYIEDNDGYVVINSTSFNKPCGEKIVQAFFGLILKTSPRYSADREVNNGRGAVDFKLSLGRADSTLLELKLASNTKLEKNLRNQLDIYKRANSTDNGLCLIVYYTERELTKISAILDKLGLAGNPNIYIIDARNDNKPTGSKA